jgi:hypothetical protein
VANNPRYDKLIVVLREARELLALPENDFAWSPWDDAEDALLEIDGLLKQIEAGELPKRSALEVLFLPTGPIQEVSLSSGWGKEFIRLATKFDAAIDRAYNPGLLARLRQLVSHGRYDSRNP